MTSSDDIYVNDGAAYDTTYYPDAPQEQKATEVTEQAIKAASYPILGDVADWFEAQIAQCDSISANIETKQMTVNGVTYTRKVSVEAQVLAQELLVEKLQDKYDEFKDFRHER